MKLVKAVVLIGIFLFVGSVWGAAGMVWTEHEQGWFWYGPFRGLPQKKKQKKTEKKVKKETKVFSKPSLKRPSQEKSYRELLKEVRAMLEEIRARALLNPTPENVAAWYVAQLYAMKLAGDFTRTSLMVPVLYPELDVSYLLPGGQWGSRALAYSDLKKKEEILSGLAARGALVIFYRSPGCFLCDKEIEVLSSMRKLYGFKIYALYQGEAPFMADRARPVTPDLEEKLGVKTYPSLFYFRGGQFHFVGMGALGTSEIERRLLLLARSKGWTAREPLYALDSLPIWKTFGLEETAHKNNLKSLLEVLKRLEKKGYEKVLQEKQE